MSGQQSAQDYQRWLALQNPEVHRHARECLEERPALGDEEIDGYIRLYPENSFQAQHPLLERSAMSFYEASIERTDYERFDPALSQPAICDFRKLWKVCLRVFHASPTLLISPAHGLRYAPAQGRGDVTGSQVVFSSAFCRLFSALIVHPCWGRSPVEFLMALQYTVKCRIDNRERWPGRKPALDYKCPNLLALDNMFEDVDGDDQSTHDMLVAVLDRSPKDSADIFCKFLVHIGSMANLTTKAEGEETYLEVPALPVTLGDMKVLAKAVETFGWPDVSWRCSPNAILTAYFKGVGIIGDEVPRRDQIKTFVQSGLKDIFRHIALDGASNPDESDDSGLSSPRRELRNVPGGNSPFASGESLRHFERSPSLGTYHPGQSSLTSGGVHGHAEPTQAQLNWAAEKEVMQAEIDRLTAENRALNVSKVLDKSRLEAYEAKVRELESQPRPSP